MDYKFLHPADLLTLMMNRIYKEGLTTTSGGNLSVLDENGDIWITPSGIDKGTLTRDDMCRVATGGKVDSCQPNGSIKVYDYRHECQPNGSIKVNDYRHECQPNGSIKVYGIHKPSVELPFHMMVYKIRPDIRAVMHAHPPAAAAFSMVRRLPDTRLGESFSRTLGDITMAEYSVPGSLRLGENIAGEFEKGYGVIVMENHGAVIGAANLFEAFIKLESLESAARLEILARKQGTPKSLNAEQLNTAALCACPVTEEFTPDSPAPDECTARRVMTEFIRRAYRQKLFGAAHGTCSVRLGGGFIITPHGADRAYIEEGDLVLINNGQTERGKIPSRSAGLHRRIYEINPEIHSIFEACPVHVMACAVTETAFDPRTIPESYIQLRDIKRIPFDTVYLRQDEAAGMLSEKTPALILENDRVLTVGDSLLKAFDRLEVMEATARSIIYANDIGRIVHISGDEIKAIDEAFGLK